MAISKGRSRQKASASLETNRVMGTLTIKPEIKKNNFLPKVGLNDCNEKTTCLCSSNQTILLATVAIHNALHSPVRARIFVRLNSLTRELAIQ